MSYKCALHPDITITHFCQTCSDLVCKNCIQKQPHSGSNHLIKQVNDAANIRKNSYVAFIEKEINPMRSDAQKKIATLHNMKNEVDRDKKVIEKDIKIEFEAINNRLSDKESAAVIAKQTQIKHLQNYVHTFDDLSSTFDSIFQNPQAVLLSYKTLDNELKRMESLKHILNSQTQDKKSNVAREFATTFSKTQTLPQHIDRNEFMNKLINYYVAYYQNKLYQVEQNNKKYGKMSELKYNSTLQKVASDQTAKFCAFCGTPFTIDNVNQQCANNRTFKMNCSYQQINWETIIPEDIRGTRRHFWYQTESAQRKKPTLDQHSMIRKTVKKHYWNALLELQTVKYIIKKYQIQNGKTFERVVEDNDTEQNGFISKIAFVYALSKIYLIPKPQIDSLIALLETNKGINYTKLTQLLQNPTDDYNKFSQAEQQMQKAKPIAPQTISYRRY